MISVHSLALGLLALLALAGWLSAPVALAAGIAMALAIGNPAAPRTSRWAKQLLQLSVVGLGFGVGLSQIWETSREGVPLTVAVIGGTLLLGWTLGRALRVPHRTAALVSAGTAICGGSAIAALAPVLEAEDEEIGAALATVFTLNAIALFVFPALGREMGLSESAFGYWAALAIHDTSSVVAAGSVYGPVALAVATTVKLARAAWIVPLVLGAAWLRRSGGRVALPWFILGFLAAAALRSALPAQAEVWDLLAQIARRLLVVTLLLIGAGTTRAVLSRVGPRPLLHGLVLWAVVSAGTLALVVLGLSGR